MILGLLPILLLTVIIVLLLGLAAALWCFAERNKLQKVLCGITILWVLMFLGLEVNLIRIYNGQETPVSGSMNFHGIWMGLIGLFSLFSYPSAVLYQKIFNVRNTLLLLSPVLLTIAVYIVWHMATGTSMNYRYLTFSELWANRFTVPVVLRSLMLLFFIAYLILNLRNIWKLIPVYQKYSDDNYSNAAHNVGWLRLVVIAIGSICSAYLLVLIWKHPAGEVIYVVITGLFFVLLSINAFSHKLFTQSEHMEVSWRLRKGWQLIDKRPLPLTQEQEYSKQEVQLDDWMKSEKPFLNPNFAANDLYTVFPELRYPVLTMLLARRNHTFKTYIRELRVVEACRIMEAEPRLLCKQVAVRVGFSSSQVLSRAFICVMGKSPDDFRHNKS